MSLKAKRNIVNKSESSGLKSSIIKRIITVVVGLLVLSALWLLIGELTPLNLPFSLSSHKQSQWNAVFLSNGQVYFGKIEKMSNDEIALIDIYYLQVVDSPLQQTQEGAISSSDQQELKLIKLGNELHGPKDKMLINRDYVLLYEELKNNSRVVEAIEAYKVQQTQ